MKPEALCTRGVCVDCIKLHKNQDAGRHVIQALIARRCSIHFAHRSYLLDVYHLCVCMSNQGAIKL